MPETVMPETTALPTRRGRPPVRSRQEQMASLLDAAAQALGSGNFANVTMDAIARAAGISKKTLYLLVPSKEALLSQLVARDLSTLELLLESGIDCAEDDRARLQHQRIVLPAELNGRSTGALDSPSVDPGGLGRIRPDQAALTMDGA